MLDGGIRNEGLSSAEAGMKMEWKVSDFSAEKRKWNENLEMETEFCKIRMEIELF
jgi:hypothetical protein